MGIGQKIYQYDSIDSTNAEAMRLGRLGAEDGTLVVAERQTKGKGRRGRTWESKEQGNLYFSLLLRPKLPADKVSMLTLVMALAVLEGAEELCGISLGIKWPNDIVAGGKKAVGILTELDFPEKDSYQVIVGVGINVIKQNFPEDIAGKATSLEEAAGKKISKEDLLTAVLIRFENHYEHFCREGSLENLREVYDSRLVNKNRMVRVLEPGGEYEGMALGITKEGRLLVAPCDSDGMADKENLKEVYAGEVSVRGIYGYV